MVSVWLTVGVTVSLHHPLFLQSDIMGVKGLFRELLGGGVVWFERDGQHRGGRHHRVRARPTPSCLWVGSAEVPDSDKLNVVSYRLILHGGKIGATHVIVKGDYE